MRFDKKIQRFPSGGGTVLSWGSELESRVFTSFHVVFIGAVDFFCSCWAEACNFVMKGLKGSELTTA